MGGVVKVEYTLSLPTSFALVADSGTRMYGKRWDPDGDAAL